MRIGIQGGTFNPIHYGHLRGAEEVREALALDQVRFIPSAEPPHKPGEDIAPAQDRLEMVRLAVAGHEGFVCDPIEVGRGGRSYTLDTLTALAHGPCRGHEMYFIVGADVFSEIHTWHRAPELLRRFHFAVTLRGSQRAEDAIATLGRTLPPLDPSFRVAMAGDGRAKVVDSEWEIRFVPVTHLDISATQVRRAICSGGSARYLLPREVELFIIRRRLYRGNA